MDKEFDSNFFDNASYEWRKNKVKLNNCEFTYKCEIILKNGNNCSKKVCKQSLNNILLKHLCAIHYKQYFNNLKKMRQRKY